MNPGLILRLGGGLLGLIALISLAWLVNDRFVQKALADDARACAKAAADLDDTAELTRCLPDVAKEIREARQSRLCNGALLPQLRPETRFMMAQACGEGVKRLVAAGDAAAADRDSLTAELGRVRADSAAAIERAERRTQTKNERIAHGQKVIQAAPRDADGDIRCDAECLRRLTQ